ncbi:MAG: DUF429 domain-containing protein [Candidatus Nanoarchaeia archaeon]
MVTVIGIDLAASMHNDSGIAVINNGKIVETRIVKTEKEILNFILKYKPKLVAIDAPLSWPSDTKDRYRQAEKILLVMGIRTFPLRGFKAMELLVKRAIRLAKTLKENNFAVIETFPSPLRAHFNTITKNPHVRDAIICANVANLYLRGQTIAYGDKKEGQIILPLR